MNKNEEISKLKRVLIEQVKSENDSRYTNLSPDEIMKTVIDASNKGKYVFWVLREYLKGNIQRFEDMGRVKQALVLFKNNLSKFTEQQKQLNKMSFQELETLVYPYQDVLTQNAVKRMNKEKIWSEIDVIYEGPEGRVYIPKTKEAAIFLGQGTKWCTAATDVENMFEYYNEEGPLYVFVTNNKDEKGREIKYQLHFKSEQFMDMEDAEINFLLLPDEHKKMFSLFFGTLSLEEKIKKFISFPELKEVLFDSKSLGVFDLNFYKSILLFDFHKSPQIKNIVDMMPEEFLSSDFFFSVLNTHRGNLKNVFANIPKKFITQEMCNMFSKNVTGLVRMGNELIPTEFLNDEILANFAKNGVHTEYFEELRDNGVITDNQFLKLCFLRMKHNFNPSKDTSEKLTEKDYREICSNKPTNIPKIFPNIPHRFKKQDFLKYVLNLNGLTLDKIEASLLNHELCEIAVRHAPNAIQYLRDEYKTEDIYLCAVEKSPHVVRNIPKKFRSKKVLDKVFDLDQSSMLLLTNEEKINYDFDYKKIVEKNPIRILYMPKNKITREMLMNSIKKEPVIVRQLSDETLGAILPEKHKIDINSFFFEPGFDKYKFYLECVQNNGLALLFIDEQFLSTELYLTALETEFKKKGFNKKLSLDEYLDILFDFDSEISRDMMNDFRMNDFRMNDFIDLFSKLRIEQLSKKYSEKYYQQNNLIYSSGKQI